MSQLKALLIAAAILVITGSLLIWADASSAGAASNPCPSRGNAYYSLALDTNGQRSHESSNGRHIHAVINRASKKLFGVSVRGRRGWQINSVLFSATTIHYSTQQTFVGNTEFAYKVQAGDVPVMILSACAFKLGGSK